MKARWEGTGDGQCARLALSVWSLGAMTQTALKVLDTGMRSLDLILKVQMHEDWKGQCG